jgi:hypothetical protein
MRTFLVVIILVMLGGPVNAEIYKWTDEKGTIHFTEDPAMIPEKYRDQVKIRLTEEDLMSIEERTRAKKIDEKAAKDRLEKSNKEYEKSLKEEKLIKDRKEREYIQYQEKLRTEREQKTRKVFEDAPMEIQPQVIMAPSPPQERRVECLRCYGKGYISCSRCYKGRISKMFVGNARTGPYYKEITCPDCNGRGEKRCSECNGVGYLWRK